MIDSPRTTYVVGSDGAYELTHIALRERPRRSGIRVVVALSRRGRYFSRFQSFWVTPNGFIDEGSGLGGFIRGVLERDANDLSPLFMRVYFALGARDVDNGISAHKLARIQVMGLATTVVVQLIVAVAYVVETRSPEASSVLYGIASVLTTLVFLLVATVFRARRRGRSLRLSSFAATSESPEARAERRK